jgi:hypothetical protein
MINLLSVEIAQANGSLVPAAVDKECPRRLARLDRRPQKTGPVTLGPLSDIDAFSTTTRKTLQFRTSIKMN